ncbi:MAG: hypothetical protein JW706_07975, partial [Opitutales bacterium]|nr:hypothetical protein [Opitutales bacterium]
NLDVRLREAVFSVHDHSLYAFDRIPYAPSVREIRPDSDRLRDPMPEYRGNKVPMLQHSL